MTARTPALLLCALVGACTDTNEPITIDLAAALDSNLDAELTRTFDVDGARDVTILSGDSPVVVEAFADGANEPWLIPAPVTADIPWHVEADGSVTLTVWGRGTPPPPVRRERSLTWFDAALLDDPATVSFSRVMAAISTDHHGGLLLDRWFRAFAAGPGAGRAAFAQFLDEVATTQGSDPAAWDLSTLPFRVTGVHLRHDLGRGIDCGELRVSIASTHPTFAPVHLIFLFHLPAAADDVTPDGNVHCRGSARRWARLSSLDDAAFLTAARTILDDTLTAEHFALAESVELSISPWQWRQWRLDAPDNITNPPLFQTVDVARVNTPGPTRDAFLAAVSANADAIARQAWEVPPAFRSAVAEVQPNIQAPLVDLSPLSVDSTLPRTIGMIGCPRCHTDDADFIQTSVDRRPSPFYDRELDARAARLDALDRGETPTSPPFGPLQTLTSNRPTPPSDPSP